MLLFATIVVFAAIVFLVLGLTWKEQGIVAARLAALRGEGVQVQVGPPGTESITIRLLGPMAQAIGQRLGGLLPQKLLAAIETRLVQAGQPVSTVGFLFATAIVEAAMVGLGLLMIAASGKFSGQTLLIIGALAGIGLFLPRIWLENRVKHRQKEILRSLPDAFDLITVCVEAGLGLDAALARVAEKVEGPFADELHTCLREVSLGRLRREALKELGERTGVQDLIAFINAVVQAESMGTGIANVLRVQADQMRTVRRQRAEAAAYKAPVKMIFPLVLCIFPTLFIVILGPAAISIYENLVTKK